MPEIQPLEPVKLREAWRHEAHDFTPWLAENIDRLGGKLNLRLEQVQAEVTLPRVGRVDLCARQAGYPPWSRRECTPPRRVQDHFPGILGLAESFISPSQARSERLVSLVPSFA